MIQSLYKNIPTIFCFPLNFFKLNHKAKDYFNKLQKNNIFINELNKLSAIINNVNFEPNYWWSKKSVKSSIKEFRNIYCKSSYHEENVQKFITDIFIQIRKRYLKLLEFLQSFYYFQSLFTFH